MISLRIIKPLTFLFWTGDTFTPQLHLKQPEFIYSAYRPFTKHCDRIQKFRETFI